MPMRLTALSLTGGLVVCLFAVGPRPALAQSSFGDVKLSYENGVVYDDDLVPGRSVDQPYILNDEDRSQQGTPSIREPSANLIGADGRSRRPDRRR